MNARCQMLGVRCAFVHEMANVTKDDMDIRCRPVLCCDVLRQVGDRLLVKPGALVPADGIVESGDSSVDESMVRR